VRILAIDPGSSCGWAVGLPINSGVWQLAPARGESPGMRYVRLRANLWAVHQAYPDLRLVVTEAAHHRGGAATEYAAGCTATIQAWCCEHSIDHTTVHSATLKKWATGKGNAGKAEMLAAARAKSFSPTTSTDDEIDALWLLAYTQAVLAP